MSSSLLLLPSFLLSAPNPQLEGMKVGQAFEMGYDIEDDGIPLEEDDTIPLIETIAEAADMRKAEDVYAIRVSSLTTVSSFFVLATGNSRPQIQAIAGAIEEDVEQKHGIQPNNGGEGTADSGWILLDFGKLVSQSVSRAEAHIAYPLISSSWLCVAPSHPPTHVPA